MTYLDGLRTHPEAHRFVYLVDRTQARVTREKGGGLILVDAPPGYVWALTNKHRISAGFNTAQEEMSALQLICVALNYGLDRCDHGEGCP